VINEKQKGIFGNSSFVNNSSVIGSNYDAIKAVKLVGHIPFFAGLKCENALIIGFGIGVTTAAIASHPEVKKIDCVELLPDLVESARFYNDFNNAVYRDKRLHVISGDGRHFLQMTENKYDLISCDPTHPVLGSGNLYTKEYFIQCLEHLNPNGMVSQYLPLHKLRWNDLLGIIKTFHSVFPNSSVWLGQYHAILIGKNGTGKINFQTWKKNIEKMPADMFLYLQPYHIAANVVMSSEMIKNLPDNIKINTDDLNYTEFFSLECFNPDNVYENLNNLSKNRCNINEVFSDMNDSEIMNKFVKGNTKLTESLYFSLLGDRTRALKSLREACIINPEDQEYPFLIKFYFGTGM
jgi:spermidine synthase